MNRPRTGKVLVTGASGFVGAALCLALERVGWRVRRAVRWAEPGLEDTVAIGELSGTTDWRQALEGCSVVVHLAALAHVATADDAAANMLYARVNADASIHLARQAAESGVQRMVFLSSAKVHGNERGLPYSETDLPQPEGPYARSKWLAEQGIAEVTQSGGPDHVILRPPLVYGPGVRANFRSLFAAVDRGIPLPFGAIRNARSLVGIDNLTSAIISSLDQPAAANRTYLVSDDNYLSTPELIEAIAQALKRRVVLLPVPIGWLRMASRLTGTSSSLERVAGSFLVSSARIRDELGWTPAVTTQRQLDDTARWWRSEA